MSEEEVVMNLIMETSEKVKKDIHSIFEKNADFFAENEHHHSKYISKLFTHYNKFFTFDKFDEADVDCLDCQTTIVKFWSTIIYDVWQREIV
mgnify:CR=1 FL=1